MKFLKENSSRIVLSLAEVVIGILLLIAPVAFTRGIIIALGVVLAAYGLVCVVRYFRDEPLTAVLEQNLCKGLVCVVVGVFCIARSQWFIDAFPVLTMLYGVANLLVGLSKVQFTADIIRLKGRWVWAAISAVLTLVFAAIILANPFATTEVLWTFIAVVLIVEAVVDLVSLIFFSKKSAGEPTVETASEEEK